MHTWSPTSRFAWQEAPYRPPHIQTPEEAMDVLRVALGACQRALHGPFSAPGDAVLMERAVEAQLRRAMAAATELSGWFEERVRTYLGGREWVDGQRVRRDSVPDHTELFGPVLESAHAARAAVRRVVAVVRAALEPWAGMEQSCMTRESLASVHDALLAYDAAAAAHYRIFAAFREARTAEVQQVWGSVPTEPDLPAALK